MGKVLLLVMLISRVILYTLVELLLICSSITVCVICLYVHLEVSFQRSQISLV